MPLNEDINYPKIMMIDCYCSYLFSIYYAISNGKSDVLYFLFNYKLEYRKLNVEENKGTYGINPWHYQPFYLSKINKKDQSHRSLINDYLKHNYNIEVSICDKINLENQNHNENIFYIINVDEYFIPENKERFMTEHSMHSLLIKKIDKTNQLVEVIDTERPTPYQIRFIDLYNSMNSIKSDSKCYMINYQNYKGISNQDIEINTNNLLFPYYDELIFELNQKNNDYKYILKGLHFSILYKIIPLVKLREQVLMNIGENDINTLSNKQVYEWTLISNLILKLIMKPNRNLSNLFDKILVMKKREEELGSLMAFLITNNNKWVKNGR